MLKALVVPQTNSATIMRLAGAVLALIGAISYLLWLTTAGVGTPQMGWDFRAYYAAAGAIQHGANLYELASATVPFYLYPPTLAALMIPFAWLTLQQATLLWLILQHAFLLASGFLVVRLALIAGRNVARPGLALFLGGLLVFLWGVGMPLRQEIYLGQVNSLLLLLALGGLYLAFASEQESGQRAVLAGLLLALAISIKVFPALLLLLLLLRGRWRTVAWTLGLFLALQVGIGLLTVGPNGYSSTLDYWFSLFPDLPGRPQPYIDNQSLNGVLARLLLPTEPPFSADQLSLWRAITFVLSVIYGGFTVVILALSTTGQHVFQRSLRPDPSARANWTLEAALLFTTINIVSSISWTHHMLWWVLPALALVARWLHVEGVGWGSYAALGLVGLLLAFSASAWLQLGADTPLLPASLFGGVHLLAMALLWALLARELLRLPVWRSVALPVVEAAAEGVL